MRASSDGWSLTVRALVRPRCLLTARRYGMQPVGIHWITHTVFGNSQHCMDSVLDQTRCSVLPRDRSGQSVHRAQGLINLLLIVDQAGCEAHV